VWTELIVSAPGHSLTVIWQRIKLYDVKSIEIYILHIYFLDSLVSPGYSHIHIAPNFVEKVSGRSGIFCKNAPTTREITVHHNLYSKVFKYPWCLYPNLCSKLYVFSVSSKSRLIFMAWQRHENLHISNISATFRASKMSLVVKVKPWN
jgi:hypothetical protein